VERLPPAATPVAVVQAVAAAAGDALTPSAFASIVSVAERLIL
jgi:hypothetical protein